MRIAIDAMGGDHAPEAVIEGTVLAQSQCMADLVLVGNEQAVREAFGRVSEGPAPEIIHAPQTIGMDESGPVAIRRKRDSSLGVAMRMLADGEVDAVVSAGNTSAIVASAKHCVGVFSGLRRPALAVFFPTETGSSLLLDAGAHAQAGAVHLAQSAVLAHIYLKVTRGIEKPRIGLLNIGQEPGKGTTTVQRAFSMIKRSGLNFIGNIEPGDMFEGRTDAIICEGFVGNIVLKTYEGISDGLIRALGQKADEAPPERAQGLRPVIETLQRSYDYQNVGGAPLLGIKKPVVVAHGKSERTAISSAILATCKMAAEQICAKMTDELEQDGALADFKYFNALLIFENLKKKWGFTERS
jgi:phosphate acyltransferase